MEVTSNNSEKLWSLNSKVLFYLLIVILCFLLASTGNAAVTVEDYEIDYRKNDYPNNAYETWYIDKRSSYDDINLFFKELQVEANYDFVYIDAWDANNSTWRRVRTYDGTGKYDFWTGYLGSGYIRVIFDSDGSVTKKGFHIAKLAGYDQGNPSASDPQRIFPQLWFQWHRFGTNDYDWLDDERMVRIYFQNSTFSSRNSGDVPQKRLPTSGDYSIDPSNQSGSVDDPLNVYGNSGYESLQNSDPDLYPNGTDNPAWNEISNMPWLSTDEELGSYMSDDYIGLDAYMGEVGGDGYEALARVYDYIWLSSNNTGYHYIGNEGYWEAGSASNSDEEDDGDIAHYVKWHDVGPPPPVPNISINVTGTDGWTNDNTISYDAVSDGPSGIDKYQYNYDNDGNIVTGWTSNSTATSFSGAPDGQYSVYVRAMDAENASNGVSGYTGGNAVADNSLAVKIDTVEPGLVSNLESTSRPASDWTNDTDVWFHWDPATDDRSGIWTYSLLDSAGSGSLPGTNQDIGNVEFARRIYSTEEDWYFNIRSQDKASNWDSDYATVGPMKIDYTEPSSSATYTGTAGDNGWFITEGDIDLSASDARSGVMKQLYRINSNNSGIYELQPRNQNWIDITGTGTATGLGDEAVTSVSLPFSFPFYGSNHNTIWIHSNGVVSLEDIGTAGWSNNSFPNATDTHTIAPLWDDFDPGANGEVYYQSLSSPNRFVVSWVDVERYGHSGTNKNSTFQVVLYEDGRIELNYKKVGLLGYNSAGTFSGVTIGLNKGDGSTHSTLRNQEKMIYGPGTSFVSRMFWQYSSPISYTTEGIHTLEHLAADTAYNAEPTNNYTLKLDFTDPPKVTDLQSTSHSLATWSNDPNLDFSWTENADTVSGMDGYSFARGALPDTTKDQEEGDTTYTMTVGQNGKYDFSVRTKDIAGNWDDDYDSTGKYWIDLGPPQITITDSEASNFITTAEDTIFYSDKMGETQDLQLLLDVTDDSSGVSNSTVDGTLFNTPSDTTYSTSSPNFILDYLISASDEDSGVLEVSTEDAAGNSGTATMQVFYDTRLQSAVLNSPDSGAILVDTVTLSSTAVDNYPAVGINKVEFWLGPPGSGTLLASDTESGDGWSYEWNTNNVSDRTYDLYVRAYDGIKNYLDSSRETVQVDNTSPAVNIANPADGDSVSAIVDFIADVEDTGSGVKKVEFYIDSNLEATDWNGSDSWMTSWNSGDVSEGTHALWVTAYDTAGNKASDTITVTVDNTQPTAEITNPLDGDSVGGTVLYSADAVDTLSGIDRVEFLVDGAVVAIDTTAVGDSYSVEWPTLSYSEGNHDLVVQAYDNSGNSATSQTATVWVDNTDPDYVQLLAPDSGASVSGTVTTEANATDTGSGIGEVEFWVDSVGGTYAGSDTDNSDSHYIISWNTSEVADGTHNLIARGIDNAGNTLLDTHQVVIDNAPPSIPNLLAPRSGLITNDSRPLFKWSTAEDTLTGVKNYELAVGQSSNFSSPDTYISTDTSLQPPGGLADGLLYWRVRAQDTAGNFSNFSSVWKLRVNTDSGLDHLVITRIRENGTEEWTEIFNPTAQTLTLKSYEEESGMSGTPNLAVDSGQYVIISDANVDGITPEINDNSSYSDADEGLRIVSTTTGGGTEVDGLGWDKSGAEADVTAGFFETEVYDNTGSDWTLERDTDANGLPVDTHDNSVDFHQVSGAATSRRGYLAVWQSRIEITSPADEHDTNVSPIVVQGTSLNGDQGDLVEVRVNENLENSGQLDASANWQLDSISLTGIGDSVVAYLYRTSSGDVLQDTDIIQVNYNDTNLLFPYNWDMEDTGPDPDWEPVKYWRRGTDNDDFVHDSTRSLSGNWSMYLDLETSYEQVASETVPVKSDHPYEVRSSFYVTGGAGPEDANIKLKISWLDNSGNQVGSREQVLHVSGQNNWEELRLADHAPAAASQARFLILAEETGSGQSLYTDNAEFVRAPEIAVTSPADNHDTYVSTITLSGTTVRTETGDSVAIVVNGSDTITGIVQNTSGDWEISGLNLAPGVNKLVAEVYRSDTGSILYDTQAITVNLTDLNITSPADGHETSAVSITVSGTAAYAEVGDSIVVTVLGGGGSGETIAGPGTGNWSANVSLTTGGNTVTARLKAEDPASQTVAADTIFIEKYEVANLLLNEVSPYGDAGGNDWLELYVKTTGRVGKGWYLDEQSGDTVPIGKLNGDLSGGDYIVVHDSSGISDTKYIDGGDGADTYWDIFDESLELTGDNGRLFIRTDTGAIRDVLIWEKHTGSLSEKTVFLEAVNADQWKLEGTIVNEFSAEASEGSVSPRVYYRQSGNAGDSNTKRDWDYIPASSTPGGPNDSSQFNAGTGTGQVDQNITNIAADGQGVTLELTYTPTVDFGAGGRDGYVEIRIPGDYPEPNLNVARDSGYLTATTTGDELEDTFVYSRGGDSCVVFILNSNFTTSTPDTLLIKYGARSGGGPGLEIPSTVGTDTFWFRADPTGNNVDTLPLTAQPVVHRDTIAAVVTVPDSVSNPRGSVDNFRAEALNTDSDPLAGVEFEYQVTEAPGPGTEVTDTEPAGGIAREGQVNYEFTTDPNTAGLNSVKIYLAGSPELADTFTDHTFGDLVGDTVVINEFIVNPNSLDHDGDGDMGDADEEYVEIYNPRSDTVDVTGWMITESSETSNGGDLSGKIPPHGFLTYYRGSAGSSSDELYIYNSDGETVAYAQPGGTLDSMNNSADTITLWNSQSGGGVVDRKHYSSYVDDKVWARKIDGWEVGDPWVNNAPPHPGVTDANQNLAGPANAAVKFSLPDTCINDQDFSAEIYVAAPNGDTVSDLYDSLLISSDSGSVNPSMLSVDGGIFSDTINIQTSDSRTVTLSGTYAITTRGTDSIAVYSGNTPPEVSLVYPDSSAYVGGSSVSGTYVLTDLDNDECTVYVEVSDDSGTTWDTVATISGAVDAQSGDSNGETYALSWDALIDMGPVYNERVKLRIKAYDGTDTGGYDTSPAFTVDNRTPARVNDLASTAGVAPAPDTGVFLTWTPSDTDYRSYNIYRVQNTSDTSQTTTVFDTTTGNGDTLTYQDAAVTYGDSFFYYVTAVDTAGNESDSSNATTAPHVTFTKTDNGDSLHRPGDTVIYTISYVNDGFGPIAYIALVDAIPDSVTLADTAEFISGPGSYIEYKVGGGWQVSSYPRSQVTQIRWVITTKQEPRSPTTSSGKIRFRSTVD